MLARRITVALLFVAVGVAAWLSSAGPTAVPASPWVTGGGVVFVAALLAAIVRWPAAARWLVPLTILVLALVATQIHLREGFPRTHDSRLHLWSLWSVHRCMLDGDLFPRWNPYMGMGYPLLQFYPPASYLAGQPFLFFGMTPVQTGATLVVLTSLGSGLTTFWSARRFGASRAASLAAAGLLVLAPYHLHDANFRFALAEVAAFVLLPPFLVLGREVVLGAPEGRRRSGWLFLAVATLLLVTHLLTALMAGVFVGLWVLVEGAFRGPRSYPRAGLGLLRMGGLCLLAAGLVGFFVVPAMLEMDHTSIGRFLPGSEKPLSGNGIDLPDLVERYGWTGYAAKRLGLPEGKDPNHVIPMYFGLTWLACLPAALILAIARRRSAAALTGAAVAGLTVASVASLLFSAGIPAFLLDGITPLRSLQFPWRFLGPAAVGTSLAAAVVIDGLAGDRRIRAILGGVLLLAAAVDSFPYQGACDWHDAYEGAAHQRWTGPGPTYAARHEPVNARLPEAIFVRVERLRFPPTEFRWRVAQAFRCHREYMTRRIFRDYVKEGVRENDTDVSAAFGVQRVYRTNQDQPEILDARALAAFRPLGGSEFFDLETRPEIRGGWIVLNLPEAHAGGEVRLLFQAFPGWIYCVDGGAWEQAQDFDGLLGATVTEGARRVHLKFSWRTPARRAGLGITVLAWLGVLGAWGSAGFRRRRTVVPTVVLVAMSSAIFPVPSHAAAPVLVPQIGHTGRITSVEVSPDGEMGLTGGEDGRILLWDFETGLELRAVGNRTQPLVDIGIHVLDLTPLLRQALRNNEMTGPRGTAVYVDAEQLTGASRPVFVYRVAEGQIQVDVDLWRGDEKLLAFGVSRPYDSAEASREALAIALADRLLEAVREIEP